MEEIKVGDRVKRCKQNAFRYHRDIEGTVIKKKSGYLNYIKWDEKTGTGQQHSTISSRFLIKLNINGTDNN